MNRLKLALEDLPTLARRLSATDIKTIAQIKLKAMSPERQLLRKLAGGTSAGARKVAPAPLRKKVTAASAGYWTPERRAAHARKIKAVMRKKRSLANLPPMSEGGNGHAPAGR